MAAQPSKVHLGPALKHAAPTISCRFAPSGEHVFFGAQDFAVWRWTLKDNKKVPLKGHESWVKALNLTSDGSWLLSGGYDGRLIWWTAGDAQPQATRRLEAHAGWIRAVEISPDDRHVATAGNDLKVRIWSLESGEQVGQLEGHEAHIYSLQFHPAGDRLVSGDLMGHVCDWEWSTGKLVRKLKIDALHKYDKTFKADIGGPRGMAFDAEGKQLACSGITNVTNAFAGVGNPLVEVFDWESGKSRIKHTSKAKLRGVAWAVALHPDGFRVAVSGGGGGGYLLFWKPDGGQEFHQFKLPNTARDMDLSNDGLHLVTAHYDGHVRISTMQAKKK